jgi:hypothetical protein
MGLGFLAFTPYISIYIDDGKGELFHFGGIPLFILIANWNCNGERKRKPEMKGIENIHAEAERMLLEGRDG